MSFLAQQTLLGHGRSGSLLSHPDTGGDTPQTLFSFQQASTHLKNQELGGLVCFAPRLFSLHTQVDVAPKTARMGIPPCTNPPPLLMGTPSPTQTPAPTHLQPFGRTRQGPPAPHCTGRPLPTPQRPPRPVPHPSLPACPPQHPQCPLPCPYLCLHRTPTRCSPMPTRVPVPCRSPAPLPPLPPGAPAHLPCLVMIISVWCLWNLAQSG